MKLKQWLAARFYVNDGWMSEVSCDAKEMFGYRSIQELPKTARMKHYRGGTSFTDIHFYYSSCVLRSTANGVRREMSVVEDFSEGR